MMKNAFYFTLKALFLVNKRLQYTYCPISQEVKTTNQAMKFGQSIEYNMRTVLLKNHTQNVLEKLFQDPYLKSQN